MFSCWTDKMFNCSIDQMFTCSPYHIRISKLVFRLFIRKSTRTGYDIKSSWKRVPSPIWIRLKIAQLLKHQSRYLPTPRIKAEASGYSRVGFHHMLNLNVPGVTTKIWNISTSVNMKNNPENALDIVNPSFTGCFIKI